MSGITNGNPLTTGVTLAITSLLTSIIIVTLVTSAAGSSPAEVSWLVFASLLMTGITSILQAGRLGRIGTGHILVVSATGIYIAVAVQALEAGGLELLAILVVASALFQCFLSGKLSVLRHVITAKVTGTLLMLVPISVVPIIVTLPQNGLQTTSAVGPIVSAAATVVTILGLRFFARSALRPWALALGILIGSLIGAGFGLYDTTYVAGISWIDLPKLQWPGFDIAFGSSFWSLLPGFLLAATIASLRTISSTTDVMRLSHGTSKAVDFRLVENAVTTEGVGNLLTGLLGALPGMVMLTNVSFARMFRGTSRNTGIAAGIIIILLAWIPKVQAFIIAIPKSVFGVYVLLAMALLFLVGLRMVARDGVDWHSGTIIGLSLLMGIGVEANLIAPGFFDTFANGALKNAMTAGGICSIVLTWSMNLTYSRAHRFEMVLDTSKIPKLHAFLRDFAHRYGRADVSTGQLENIGEEALVMLQRSQDGKTETGMRRVRVLARRVRGGATLEFVSTLETADNLEDQIVLLGRQVNLDTLEEEIPLRILRNLATTVHHQQFHGVDILTLRMHNPSAQPEV